MELLADVIVAVAGTAVGLIMGLSGAGGGILAVPVLVYTQTWGMQQAAPVALLAVTAGAMIGAADGLQKKLTRYRAALLMALAGAPATFAGVGLAQRLSQAWLMGSFALMMLLVALRLLRRAQAGPGEDAQRPVAARINDYTGRFDWNLKSAGVIAAIGSMAGLVTGLLGVGGGFVIVPMLRHFTNASMQVAVATSLLVISLVGSMGIASALLHGAVLPPQISFVFASYTIAGMLLGRRLILRLPARAVQQLFGALLVLVAACLLYRAW